MRQLSVSIVVAATWAGCGDAPPAHDVTLPSRLAATPAPAPQPVLTITLTKDGRVVVDGESLTLDRLSNLLAERCREVTHHSPSGFEVSRLVCRLRIDRAARWRHVQWLLTMLAEQRVLHARFVVLDGEGAEVDLAWEFPVDYWGIREAPPLRFLWVHVALDSGGVLRCGDFESVEPAAFRRFLQDARARVAADGLDGLAGEIEGAGLAPWGRCAAVFELLLAAGAEQLDFRGAEIPGSTVRDLDLLPVPPDADRRSSDGSLSVRGAWRDDGRLTFEEPEEEIVEEPIPDEESR